MDMPMSSRNCGLRTGCYFFLTSVAIIEEQPIGLTRSLCSIPRQFVAGFRCGARSVDSSCLTEGECHTSDSATAVDELLSIIF